MKHPSWGIGLVLLGLSALAGQGEQRVLTPDLSTITDGTSWTLHDSTAEVVEVDGRKAVRLRSKGDSADGIIGLALVNGFELTTGTIEVDLKGKNVRQRSFLGVAFNVVDAKTFEAIYFRPFNFQAEGAYKGRAVQYLSWPVNTWEKLRESQPGVFEAPVQPVPDPDGWFHARIEIGEKQVRVFVGSATAPSLTVQRLAEGGKARPVGLFVDVAEGLYADFKVTADP